MIYEEKIYNYLADKVIEDLNNDTLPSDIAEAMCFNPMNDYLRSKNTNTKEIILKLLENKATNDQVKRLALMISRPHQQDPDIKDAIFKIWQTRSDNIYLGFASIYRLLEYQDVTEDNKERFFTYIKNNWKEWRKIVQLSYLETSKVLPGARKRLNNPDFPSWKKWIYLTEIAASSHVGESIDFLSNFDTQGDRFKNKLKAWAMEELKSMLGKSSYP